MGINRTLLQGAGIALVLMGASAQADDAADVRKAVMGHEAFLQRCVDEQIVAAAAEAGVDAAVIEEVGELGRQQVRRLCENYYKQVNVCMPGGTANAIDRMQKIIHELNKKLTDPLTRAQDYDLYGRMKRNSERELVALHDMAEGRTNYCDTGQNES